MQSIVVENVSKLYTLGTTFTQGRTLRDALARAISSPLATLREVVNRQGPASYTALDDVTVAIQQGETVGIVGRNGAGKSTLLKILSRITEPTQGRAIVRGRVASLLEVGTGFHPELTGRENIYLNAAILGMRRAEVTRRLDEIVEFAGVAKFLDTPVKHYSSGMYVRLAFAVAAHVEAEILLVDEVLAVGDAEFQRRCLGRMGEVASKGRTVLLVSHNLAAIRSLCSRVLVFEKGRLEFSGDAAGGLARYEESFSMDSASLDPSHFQGDLAGDLVVNGLVLQQEGSKVSQLDPAKRFTIEVRGRANRYLPGVELKVSVFRDGLHLTSCFDTSTPVAMPEADFSSTFEFDAGVFRPGRYYLGVGAVAQGGRWMWGADLALLDFSEVWIDGSSDRSRGLVSVACRSERRNLI